MKAILTISVFVLAGAAALLVSAPAETGLKGRYERIKVHGKSLEGNLEGDSPDREVSVYLPPSYATERNHRYPAVYLLHGYTNSDEGWYGPNTKSGFQSAATPRCPPWQTMP
jgi:hypothetical protein